VTDSAKAVFLSYASQDVEPAQKLQRETRYSHPIIRSGRRRHANGSIARNAADWITEERDNILPCQRFYT